jgi:succinate-semialdehyde dehydrogenase/glutarate-semialdehyde dehydrogenase
MTYQSFNTYDGKVMKTFKDTTDGQLEAALTTAAACFETVRRETSS